MDKGGEFETNECETSLVNAQVRYTECLESMNRARNVELGWWLWG